MKYNKIVVILCAIGADGKFVMREHDRAPHGYHHILGVWGENSYFPLAHIFGTVSEGKVGEIAKILAGDTPVEFDPDFYANL